MDGISLETIEDLSSRTSPVAGWRVLGGRDESKHPKVKATLVFLQHLFLVTLEKTLGRIGLFFRRGRLPVILATLFFLAALCLGLLRSNYKKIPPRLYENYNGRSKQLLSEAGKAFGTLDSWKVTIYFSSKSSGIIFSSGCLEYAGIIHDRVINTSWFKEHCIIESNGFCEINSPLTLKGLKRRDIQILTSNAQNATAIHFNEALRLYNVSVTNQISAQAISISHFMRKPRNVEERNEFKKFWSNQKTSVLLRKGSGIHCESVHVLNTSIYDDNVWTVLFFERLPLLYAIPVFFSLGFILMALKCNGLMSFFAITLLIVCVSVGFICAFGICNTFGMPFQEIFAVVLCFLVSKTFTDALLLLRSFKIICRLPLPDHRVSGCMTTAGLVITVTSLMSCILFAFPIWSSFDGVTNFFAFALSSTILAYLTVLTLFLKVLFGLSKVRNRIISQPSSAIGNTTSRNGARLLTKYLVRFLISAPGKVILSFIGLGLVVICGFVLVTRGIKIGTDDSIYERTNTMDKVTYDIFPPSVEDASILFTKGLGYSNRNSRTNVIAFINKFKMTCDNKCTAASSWIESFERWKIGSGQTCHVGRFYVCLGHFLRNNVTSIFQSDINLGKQDNTIQTSRVRIPVIFSSNIFKDASMLELLQEILRTSMFRDNAVIASSVMVVLEDFQTFLTETLYVFIFLTVMLTLSLFPLTSCIRTPLLLISRCFMLNMEVLTIMCLLDIPLNQLSFTCVYLVIVFSFIASVYFSETHIIFKKEAIQDQVIDAIEVNLVPIISGIGLAILTSFALGFSFPFLSLLFSKVIPALIITGSIYAFTFLPCVLSTQRNRNSLGHSVLTMSSFIERGLKRKSAITVDCVTHDSKRVEKAKSPSVSIIGISFRFPQASNKDEFWDMLKNGRCCISSFPENRPDEFKKFKDNYHSMRFVPGRLCTLGGAYLDNIRNFDAEFFGISPQEANQMDPQQKILLHVAYEAIEDSGMKLEDLQACRTGVFVGLMNRDFADFTNNSHLRNMDQFPASGISASIVSNRISFCFNFNGPSFTVDTACSSILEVFNLAVDSFLNEDCEVALVCPADIILSYADHMTTSISVLLAPDGRCKSFDSVGDGYGRGEGFAAVVLKLSDQAFEGEDDVYCEVVACGLNSDGANSVPITAPSSRGQSDLFQAVPKNSGLHANDIDYIETRATGTAIEDVVENTSIAEVYGNTKRPLRIGSVKSNLNHTESTSGLARLVKLALMIKYGYLVPTINIQVLNPKLKMTEKGLVVQEMFEPWKPRDGKSRIGAVNSYGFGGSKAHAILREATRPKEFNNLELTSSYCNGTNIITLSALSLNALKDSARLHSQWLLENAKLANNLRDVCFSLNERRTVHPYRLALAFNSLEEAVSALNEYNEGSIAWEKMVSNGKGIIGRKKPVFMFGGQGVQWYAMGRQLIEKETVVANTITQIDKVLKELGEGWKLKEEILASKENSKVDQVIVGQVATFSIQLAVARLLISWGVYPAAVIGQSLGEFAAACIAGALTLKETLTVVLLRAKQQLTCPEDGAMAALGVSAEEAQSLIEELRLGSSVEIAGYNDARCVTLSGDKLAIEKIGDYLSANNVQVFWRIFNTSRAFHSFHMAPLEASFKHAAQRECLNPKEVIIPLYSTVEGDVVNGNKLDWGYWWKNIRNHVKFHQAIKSVLSDGYTELIEISAQPFLMRYIKKIAAQEDISDESRPVVISTLPRKTVEEQHKVFIQNTICQLYTLGYPIQWPRVRGKGSCSFVRPPTYPWQEKEYWYKSHPPHKETVGSSSEGRTQYVVNHPFVGEINKAEQLTGQSCWTLEIDLHRFAFLKDHALINRGSIMPGAAYIEMALAMAKDRLLCSTIELRGVRLWSLLNLPESQVRLLNLRFSQGTNLGEATFKITCVQKNKRELLLSSGEICCDVMKGKGYSGTALHPTANLNPFDPIIQALQERMEEMPVEEFKEITSRYGFSYGPCFSFINQVWKGENEGLCVVNVDEGLVDEHELSTYVVHPSILDASLQSCFVTISEISEMPIVPVAVERVELTAVPVERNMVCHVTTSVEIFGSYDVTLMNLRGDVVLKIIKFQVAELTASKLSAPPLLEDIIYEMQWKELPKDYLSQPPSFNGMICVVLKESRGICSSFVARLKNEGVGLIKPCRVGNYLTIKETNLIPKPNDLTLKESAYIPICLGIALVFIQRVTSNCDSMNILIHEGDSIIGLAAAIISKTQGYLVLCTAQRELQETEEILLGHKLDVISDVSCIELGENYDDFFDAVIYLSVPEPGSLQHSFRSLKPNGKLFLACNDLKAAIILPEQKSIKYERIRMADMIDISSTHINHWFNHYNTEMLKVITKALQSLPQLDVHLFEAIQKWNNSCNEPVQNVVARLYDLDNTEEQKAIFAGIDHFGLKENRSYIVAGGVRGFGFEVARWMCENGANTVILLARSKPSQDKLQEAAALQKKTKTKVIIMQIDISREDDILSLEHKLQDVPSVAGIVLTAMVLRDNMISLMDIDSYRDVMAPKVTANAYLDALASYRRHVLGLPGLSINWGPSGGAGILTREDNVASLLATVGFGLISAVKGPEYMGKGSCYQPGRTQIGIFMVDWSVFCKTNKHLSETNRLEFLRNEEIPAGAKDESASSLASRMLLEKNMSKRNKMIEEFVTGMLCSWLGVESLSEVDFNTSLYSYGVDSTGALTNKMQLESSLQISFEVFYLMQPDTTPSKIVQDIIQRMDGANTPNEESQACTIKQESTKIEEEPRGINIANGKQQPTKTPCQAVLLYKPEKAEIKFFCIHPSHRFAMSLAGIAFGFQSQDLVSFYPIGYTDPTEKGTWGSVRELAVAYLELILEKQEHGPYFIGGYSYGGLVPYEIACLLIEHEEQVKFLFMIDTFSWLSPWHGEYSGQPSSLRTNVSAQNQVELQFMVYLEKLALRNLEMTKQEYDEMALQQPTTCVTEPLQTRSRQMNIRIYEVAALWESIVNDHVIASKTHEDWKPASTQYEGHLTYIKCEDQKYSPTLPLKVSPHKAWNKVLPGPLDVLVCRGDYCSLSELPLARVTGGIVVNAVGIKYRSLFPELYHFDTTYKQRKSIEHFRNGIPALVYSKKGHKAPKSVKLFLDEEKCIIFFSQNRGTSSKLKSINLQELRGILPGTYVRNAIKVVAKTNSSKSMEPQQGNLYNVVSLFGKKRIFNVEFLSLDTLKEFYQVIEAIYNLKMELF